MRLSTQFPPSINVITQKTGFAQRRLGVLLLLAHNRKCIFEGSVDKCLLNSMDTKNWTFPSDEFPHLGFFKSNFHFSVKRIIMHSIYAKSEKPPWTNLFPATISARHLKSNLEWQTPGIPEAGSAALIQLPQKWLNSGSWAAALPKIIVFAESKKFFAVMLLFRRLQTHFIA